MVLKKILTYTMAAVMATSVAIPSANVMAAAKMDKKQQKKVVRPVRKTLGLNNKKATMKELLKGIEITKVKWNDNAWARALEFEEFDKFNGGVAKYIQKIKEIKVNNRKYVEAGSASPDAQAFTYDFSANGLRLKSGAFKDGVNSIVIAAEGYMTKTINFAKTGDVYSFISQRDTDPDNPGDDKPDPTALKKEISDAKKIEKGKKSPEAWQALNDAIAMAENTLKTPVENQVTYDKAMIDLRRAVTAFKESKDNTEVVKDPIKKGTYTLSFIVNEEGKETSSMIQKTLDKKVKLVVKDDNTMEVSFLNDKIPDKLLDFSVAMQGEKFPEAEKKGFGKKNKEGRYEAYEYTLPIKHVEQKCKAAALVTAMGGQADQVHDFDKYRKADLMFTSIKEGWKGYQKEIDSQHVEDGVENLKQELIALGLDKNNDGQITKDEMAQYDDDKLVINNCGLTDISMLKGLPGTVKTIDLCNNKITKIPDGFFESMTGLENFWVENNDIKGLQKDVFRGADNLKWIALTNNDITALNKGSLNGVPKLEQLDLEGNLIKKVDKDAFQGLKKLYSLSLVGNGLKTIPDGTFKPVSKTLRWLFMHENDFLTLPKAISDMDAAEKITAFDCKIRSIDDVDFSKMEDLKEVNLHKNDIVRVKDGTFRNNHKMEVLDLFDNQLKNFTANALPSDVSFRNLDVSMNNMNVVDPALATHQKYNKFYPQKTAMSFNLKKVGKTKVQWSQKLSILDLMFWQFYTNDFMKAEIDSVGGYKELLEDHGWSGDNFIKMLNKENFDWDIKTELQKKNSKGEFETVKKDVNSDKADIMSGTYNVEPRGVYRVVKKMYTTRGGNKTYRFRVMTDALDMSTAGIKKVSLSSVRTLKAKAAGYGKVKLSWSKVAGAAGYQVVSKAVNGKSFSNIAKNVKGTTYVAKKLKTGKKYQFKVRAFAKSGSKTVYGSWSKVAVATPKLDRTKIKKAKAKGKRRILLLWKKIAGATGYKIYISKHKNRGYKVAASVKKGKLVKYVLGKRAKGKYFIKIRAFVKQGGKTVYSGYSNIKSVKLRR